METKTKPRSGSILKPTIPIIITEAVDCTPTLANDAIAQKMLENRNIKDSGVIDDVAEQERQKRLYLLIKSSSKYKHLQLKKANSQLSDQEELDEYDGESTISRTPNRSYMMLNTNLFTHSNDGSNTPKDSQSSRSNSSIPSKPHSRNNSSRPEPTILSGRSDSMLLDRAGILKVTAVPQPENTIDHSIQTLDNDDIAQSMLENRSITDSMLISDDAEIERQQRLYTMLRTSSKYKRLQVTLILTKIQKANSMSGSMLANSGDSIATESSVHDFSADLDALDFDLKSERSYESSDSIVISRERISSGKNTIRAKHSSATSQDLDKSNAMSLNPSILGWAISNSLEATEASSETLDGSQSFMTQNGEEVTCTTISSWKSRLIFLNSSYSNSVFSDIQQLDAYRAKNPGEKLYIVVSETEEAFVCRFVELPLTMAVIFDPDCKLRNSFGTLKPISCYNAAVVPRRRRVRFSDKTEVVPFKSYKKSGLGISGIFKRILGK